MNKKSCPLTLINVCAKGDIDDDVAVFFAAEKDFNKIECLCARKKFLVFLRKFLGTYQIGKNGFKRRISFKLEEEISNIIHTQN